MTLLLAVPGGRLVRYLAVLHSTVTAGAKVPLKCNLTLCLSKLAADTGPLHMR